MRTAYWDSGLRWDDPNLRWGDPSYLLEPGDPGYTPPSPPPTPITPKKKGRLMASNPIPIALPALFSLAEDMADGLNTHQAAIGIAQNTEARVRADLAAARAAETDYSVAKGNKDTLSSNLQIADSNARAFLGAARAVLVQRYGPTWSAAWEPTGFPNQSTAVPRLQDERLDLCASLNAYFTANPTHEVAALGVTAANADTRFTALSDARQAMNGGSTVAGQKKAVRAAAVDALKTRMRGLIGELGQLLDATDPRWHAFGLNAPGDSDLPDIPAGLVLTPGAPTKVNADWADARRALYYRIFIMIVGTDTEFRHLFNRDESDATLEELPSGATVRVQVTAANDSGESQPSDVKEIVVP